MALLPTSGGAAGGREAGGDVLRTNATVQTLSLERNNVGDAGARALADGLRTNATVHTLHLRGNEIGPVCGWAVGRALVGCRRKVYERGLYYEMLLMISLCEQGPMRRLERGAVQVEGPDAVLLLGLALAANEMHLAQSLLQRVARYCV